MRVLQSATVIKDGRVEFNGAPLTGSLFQLEKDGVTIRAELSVLGGHAIGPSPLGPWALDRPRYAAQECDENPLDGGGSPVSGIVLFFRADGTLAEEYEYEDGVPCGRWFYWDETGSLGSHGRPGPRGEDIESWHSSGAIWTIQRQGLVATFGDAGPLSRLSLEDGHSGLNTIPMVVGEGLSLAGVGVTDSVISLLSDVTTVKSLALTETRVSSIGLSVFTGLSELKTERNESLDSAAVAGYLSSNPGCHWFDLDAYG